VARSLLERAAAGGADLAVLPEYVDYLGRAEGAPKPEPIDGEFATFFASAAQELGINVLAGSFHETGPDDEHSFNTMPVFDRSGTLVGAYRKIHLYDVEIPGRVSRHIVRPPGARRLRHPLPMASVAKATSRLLPMMSGVFWCSSAGI